MIKFFRRIRKRLLTENKFSKYLLYAIGEIILVVIGILIALQFNNRNEQRKNLELISETLITLEDDLLYNFDNASFTLNFYKTQDKICKQVLFDGLTLNDYRSNDLIGIVTANWEITTPKTENISVVLDNEKSADKKLRPIINAVKRFVHRKDLMDQQWNVLYNNIQENIETLTKKVSLVRLDSTSKEERFQYMLTNKDYKKTVELYWINIQNYYDQLSRFRASNMALLSTIKMVQENYDKAALETLYKSKGMSAFIPTDCKQHQASKNDELRFSYLIGNLSTKDIKLNMINDGKIGGSYLLKPNEFRVSRPEFAGLGGDYTVIAEQIDTDGNCLQKFIAVNKGYLLIE
ncbi:hypothetical protein [uncultured Winogradskyella sp.]|uniref:hypothetical protein n=1 Tax=uncultured Winogradskyella sp. TaxID=395353 RepID=UPI002609D41D|nr:hypothetical protein [uncultured Winogradskyella sp.]